jgi:hypothetical protein
MLAVDLPSQILRAGAVSPFLGHHNATAPPPYIHFPNVQKSKLARKGLRSRWIFSEVSVEHYVEHPRTMASSRQGQWIARYVAVSFRRTGRNFAPGPAFICRNASLAEQCAERMTRTTEIAGAVAFTRHRHLDSREFGTAVILKTFGDIPEGFDIG